MPDPAFSYRPTNLGAVPDMPLLGARGLIGTLFSGGFGFADANVEPDSL
jgi:hypothetical protein